MAGAKTYRRFHSAHRLGSLSHEKVCSLDSWPSRGMTYMIHWITFERRAKISKGAHRADRISRKHSQVCKYRWLEWRTGLFHRSQYTLWDENGRGELGGWRLLFFSTCHVFQIGPTTVAQGKRPLCTVNDYSSYHYAFMTRVKWSDANCSDRHSSHIRGNDARLRQKHRNRNLKRCLVLMGQTQKKAEWSEVMTVLSSWDGCHSHLVPMWTT